MLKIRVIPCLDVKEGRVVKGINFLDLKDAGDPVEQAKIYDEQGADELCFLDITASIEKRDILFDIVNKTAKKCFMPLTVGGGVKKVEDVRKLLYSGADKVSINSSAIYEPQLIKDASNRFGKQCIVIAIDAKKTSKSSCKSGYEVFSHGGTKETNLDAVVWAKQCADFGAGDVLLTSMDNDGTKKGFNIELTNKVTKSIKIPVIASGGVGELKHFIEGACETEATGLLAASVFHFGKFTINEVKKELNKNGVAVRL